jgi:oxaloacetate decarboxylase alpha subunit
VPAVLAAIGEKKLEMHIHSTIGYGALSSLVGAELGASAVHVGIGPLGDGSALPEAVRMVANLRALGHEVGVDDAALAAVESYWWRLAKAEGLPPGTPQSFDASFLKHQIAGGVMTTIVRQLQELKLEHRMGDVIAETEQVRRDLGQPIMVTPFPQMVCTQALFNVVGAGRYAQVSDQVIRYVLGKFGRPTRPVDEAVRNTILDRARAREIEKEQDFPTLAELRKRFGGEMPEEEFLLRAVMPGDQVDAMMAAGKSRACYTPEVAPVIELLKQLAARPASREIVVERPTFRLSLKSGPQLEPSR